MVLAALLPVDKRCAAVAKHGGPCQAAKRPGKSLCFLHDPEAQAAARAARAAGGQATVALRVQSTEQLLALDLTVPDQLTAFRKGVMALVLHGHLEPAAAGKVIECAGLISASSRAADASASTSAMAQALAAALREQG